MKWTIITYYIGVALLLVAAFMGISGIVACFTPGDESAAPLLYSASITGLTGIFPLIFVRNDHHKLSFREGNTIVVGSWLSACLFGMVPYIIFGHEFTPVNALFESVSGFTTTGASILNGIEALPKGLQFWRFSTAWMGGVGIVTLFSMIITSQDDKSLLSGAEISKMAKAPLMGQRSVSFAKRMLATYITLTVVTLLALRFSGLEWFDSVTNAMSACSTCGFCPRNISIAFYENPTAEVILTFAMLAAGLNFGVLFLTFFKGKPIYFWKSEIIRVFISCVAIAISIITADLLISGNYHSFGKALRDASFQVVSISTTTGFATKDTMLWPPMSMAVLVICSIVCGCSGSTSGGIKMDRIILAVKGVARKVTLTFSPNAVRAIWVDGRSRSDTQLNDAFAFIFCYLLVVIIFAAINIASGLDFMTGVTASIACVGNVGPGFGDIGSMSNYSSLPGFIKLSGMAEMLIGRLEIFPVLYLLSSIRMKRSRIG